MDNHSEDKYLGRISGLVLTTMSLTRHLLVLIFGLKSKVMMVRMVPMAQMVKTEKVFLKYKLFIKLIIVRLESIHTPQVGVKLSQHRVLIQDICGHIKKPRTLMEVPKLPLLTLSDRMAKMVLIYHLLRYGSFCCNRIPTSCIKEATEKST